MKVSVLEKSFHFIFMRIKDPDRPTVLRMIYGDPHHTLNGYIWEWIQFYANQLNPLCLISHFNAILYPHEKHRESRKTRASNRAFRRMTEDAGLMDLGYQGLRILGQMEERVQVWCSKGWIGQWQLLGGRGCSQKQRYIICHVSTVITTLFY